MTCRSKVTKVRCLCADFICNIKVKFNACLFSDSRKVKHCICWTTESHINCKSIHKCLFCHNVERTDILFEKFHYLHTCVFSKFDSLWINGRNCTVTLQAHTDSLCKAVHTVCRVHTRTRTAWRASLVLKLAKFLCRNFVCRVSAYSLKHTWKACLFTLYMTCEHWTAAYKNGRNINSCGSH